MSEPEAAAPTPMDQLRQDPSIGPVMAKLRGAELYRALRARLKVENNANNRRLLEEVLGDRRWFLEPITSAPTMSSINGIGTKLYGESERAPDGTHVATLFFIVLFIPIYPIAQYLVQELGGRKWSFYGKVPPSPVIVAWRLVMKLAFVSAAAAIAWGVIENSSHSDVHFLNALDVPVQISAGKKQLTVPAGGRVSERVKSGKLTVRVQIGGQLVEEEKVEVPGGFDLVAYNVLGAAPLFRENVIYYPDSVTHPPEDKSLPEFFAGQRLVTAKDVDYVFRDQPQTIEMDKNASSTTRTHVDVVPGGWKISVAYLLSQKKSELAATIAERVLGARPDDLNALGVALTVVQRARGSAAVAQFTERAAAAHPDSLEIQRLYQNEMIMAGKRAELVPKYHDALAKHPDSALYAYLDARLAPQAEAVARFAELLLKFPDDVNLLHGLAGSLLQTRRFAEAAAQFEKLDKLRAAGDDELGGWAEALIGAGKGGEAAKLVAERARKGGANAKLYAEVARVAGKEAPHPPDFFIAESGPDRSWFEARMGQAGAFAKLKPLDDDLQSAYTALLAARQGGKPFLDALAATGGEVFGDLGRSLGILAAAEALRLGDKERATQLLDQIIPPATASERAAVLDGKDNPELAELSLDNQAALLLARAWRNGDRKLAERARADDLLRDSVDLALSWK
jgi:Flp pilus assembly protein TadD